MGRRPVFGIRVVLLVVLGLSACDRPFREVEPPSISIVEPDLAVVQPSDEVILKVDVQSFRQVDRLERDGRLVSFDSTTGLWTDTLRLVPGVNRLALQAFDVDGVVRTDSVYLVYTEISRLLLPQPIPGARGGHTATLLDDGQVLILGGATSATGGARRDAFLYSLGTGGETLSEGLAAARVGHTASRLPDGRVLIVGGSQWGRIESLADLVAEVEVFDPRDQSFRTVPLVGEPIRRAYHTAAVYEDGDDVLLDVFGGRGDVSYGGSGSLGTRRDLRTYLFQNDTLYQRTSAIGGILLEPLSGHTQTSLTNASDRRMERSLIVGSRFAGGQFETVSLLVDYTRGSGPRVFDSAPLLTPRTQHAAAPVGTGAVLMFGGRQESGDAPVSASELYIHELEAFLRLPQGLPGFSRFGHTATKLLDGRILVVGGFGTGSVALPEVSVITTRF